MNFHNNFNNFAIPTQPLNVNMNINLLQGELNVSSIYAPQNNNFNGFHNQQYFQPNNESFYLSNFNNLYNSMKSNPNVKRNFDKKK